MFEMRLIQAEEGDSFLLHYGTPAAPRHLLVDGGPEDIFHDHIAGTLDRYVKSDALDLVICSHSDSDHTLGLVDLFAELKSELDADDAPRVTPAGIWHNSFADTVGQSIADDTQALLDAVHAQGFSMANTEADINGIEDGRALRRFALLTNTPVNAQSGGQPLVHDPAAAPPSFVFGNLTLTVIAPMPAQLLALQQEWEAWLDANEDRIDRGEVDLAANSDTSVRNLSSLQVLAEADGKTMLLTGDGRSDHLLDGLQAAGLLDANGKMHVDLLKLAHHGSDRNVTKTFLKNVTADIYVASGNGKNSNPDYATLKWIIEAAHGQGRSPQIVTTNRTAEIDRILNDFPRSQFDYSIRWMRSSWHSTRIALA